MPEAFASLLRTLVVALFLLTFLLQPFLIPSESMERTLLVGDFLLVNKQVLSPAGTVGRWLMPYRDVERGDVVVFHHPDPAYLVKRVIGLPGDHVRIAKGQVYINGAALQEPYAVYEPALVSRFRDNFPGGSGPEDPSVDPAWWQQMRGLTEDGALVVPKGELFVMGDNRNHSDDSRYWGLVPRSAIVARPLVIYFSLRKKSSTDVQAGANDRLGHNSGFSARVAAFARWKRIFTVVR
ncbi:MAG TPA: signal peptidase I [Terracidiphilus sp.]|nr:signal peptidase I [Terracidiphilus sp.]